MVTWFTAVMSFVIAQRIAELVIANKNMRYAKSLRGYEVGKEHYPFMVILHVLFLGCLIIETMQKGDLQVKPIPVFLALFFMAQVIRIWVIASLGKMWNTRIIINPNSKPVTKGPYRYIRHPNYFVVILEIVSLPLSFGAIWTAIIFSGLNLVLLKIRIKAEEEGLKQIAAFREYLK